jgi:hypothetical protein
MTAMLVAPDAAAEGVAEAGAEAAGGVWAVALRASPDANVTISANVRFIAVENSF